MTTMPSAGAQLFDRRTTVIDEHRVRSQHGQVKRRIVRSARHDHSSTAIGARR